MMVFRCFVEKKPGFDVEAQDLLSELKGPLRVLGLEGLRLFRRYDVEGVAPRTYAAAKAGILAEPQVDRLWDERMPELGRGWTVLAVEALPGQFDQRSDSAAQCIQLMAGGERPRVAAATLYALTGAVSGEDLARIKSYLINPVESREAAMDKPVTLEGQYPVPKAVPILTGFLGLEEDGLRALSEQYGLAMDLSDLRFLQTYFQEEERRDPTLTELRVVDTYWSDHCRHTTFSTHIDSVEILDDDVQAAYQRYLARRVEVYGEERAAARPQTLMDLATLGAKVLKKRGLLDKLDESEEINACSVHMSATVDGEEQDWLLMFKNETHNHPTEIEPFGGAATCIGGAIRDPLSGRAYVYQAMRITGCGDPRTPIADTIPGKLPQRKLCQTAAAGYSSYGNQIGLATGLVHEIYHPGYVAKHLELGAVVGAAPASHVRREAPAPGDVVILLGGRTGRDGIGGATGSSKSHDQKSLDTMASEVQKGNAPEERKLQRLFRDGNVTRLIKRCNDFGAGGVAVAIGELSDGLEIDLDAVRKKYDGLDGTELAISESQERMAVVVAPADVTALMDAAERENLEAYVVAEVTASPRMVMRWNGETICDLSRAFLNTNGADKHVTVRVPRQEPPAPRRERPDRGPAATAPLRRLRALAQELSTCSQRGLMERFDSSIGAATVLAPYGGAHQRTPVQAMAALLPVGPGRETDACSVMAWGFDPEAMEANPFRGAAASVVESIAKLVAAGCNPGTVYLSFQEYFEKLREEPERWGKPFAALLGALEAQVGLGAAAIGGKDSMSGSFLDLDVPPTLVSFAISPSRAESVLSPEFKAPGHVVSLWEVPQTGDYPAILAAWEHFHALCASGKVLSAWALGRRGMAEAVLNMSLGNGVGFALDGDFDPEDFFAGRCGSLLFESEDPVEGAVPVGRTIPGEKGISLGNKASLPLNELLSYWEGTLSDVYPTATAEDWEDRWPRVEAISCPRRSPALFTGSCGKPRAVIPVFPGTNCEYDTAAACERAGIAPEILVVRNLTAEGLRDSAEALVRAVGSAQMVILPGGFSGGDEPDGSAKFICSFFRGAALTEAVHDLLQNRDGLMLGICNGFQALVKLGLVPFGEIRPADERCPTLTYNHIGRHQSRYVTTRVASVRSPWMLKSQVGDLHTIPVSHGEGRFVCPEDLLKDLIGAGQVATQYVNPFTGMPEMHIDVNPNGSVACVEGLFSPDGRVFGKMGHSERRGPWAAKNIPGEKHQPLFESGALYFK